MSSLSISRGPVMADIAGFELTDNEIKRLQHPAVGGVILFRRNFQSVEQLKSLTAMIKNIRTPELLIAVDHEGGRVQRFLHGFTRLPAMRTLGEIAGQDLPKAKQLAQKVGFVLATELRAVGVDLSFTPVLDLDWNNSSIIGNRSFHTDPEMVSHLALALQVGLNQGGMKACGKHFPGHGYVTGDSHHVLPEDQRNFAEILAADLVPFKKLINEHLAAIMPAHVVYSQVDAKPAGFSSFWLQHILRQQMNFTGMIFSDDLTMEGACGVGNIQLRAETSFQAGCDVVLVCNHPELVDELLEHFQIPVNPELERRWKDSFGLYSQKYFEDLLATDQFIAIQEEVASLYEEEDLSVCVPVGES